MKQHSPAQIEATANEIKAHFIPKDQEAKSFSFHFTIPPSSNYKVSYEKDVTGEWVLKAYEADLEKRA